MISITTGRGQIDWAFISGQGKADLNGNMKYSVDITLDAEAAKPTIDAINQLWEDEKPKGAKAPKSLGFKETEDGRVKFTFKTATTYPKTGDPKVIAVYDSKANKVEWPADKKIGNGSIGKVSGMAAVYDAGAASRGVTLYLDAIQLLKLVEYVGKGPSFDVEEDGEFEAAEPAFTSEDLV
jgi:hypothetical protein